MRFLISIAPSFGKLKGDKEPSSVSIYFSALLLFLAFSSSLNAASKRAYNQLAVDIPLDGGGFVSYSRMWRVRRSVHLGFVAGGGVVERDFELKLTSENRRVDATTESLVLPYVGPRLLIQGNYVGLSIGFGGFWAKSDLEVKWIDGSTLKGQTSGWGTGVYAPFLVLDLYNTKNNVLLGIGMGGFIGTSFPRLRAESSQARVSTKENPLETLSVHFRALWSDSDLWFLQDSKDLDDEF